MGQKVGKLRYIILKDGKKSMNFQDAFAIGNNVSIVGSGGKTSTMYAIACELARQNHKVIMTTTTHILPFENKMPDNVMVDAIEAGNGRLTGRGNIGEIARKCDYLLIEADGSRGLPAKYMGEHEPAIADESTQVIGVFGLSSIGKTIAEVCHRAELFCDRYGRNISDIMTIDDAVALITSSDCLYKNVNERDFVIILNQADTEREIALGMEIANRLPNNIQCVITAYENTD